MLYCMFIRDLKKCREFIAGDKTVLRELFNPLKDEMGLRYSLAHAIVKPGQVTQNQTENKRSLLHTAGKKNNAY